VTRRPDGSFYYIWEISDLFCKEEWPEPIYFSIKRNLTASGEFYTSVVVKLLVLHTVCMSNHYLPAAIWQREHPATYQLILQVESGVVWTPQAQ